MSWPPPSPTRKTTNSTMDSRTLFALIFLCHVAQVRLETVDVMMRCENSCDLGSCVSATLQVNECTPYCNPCEGACLNYYLLSSNGDNTYNLELYGTASCQRAISPVSALVKCDSCVTDAGSVCSSFYLDCLSPTPWFVSSNSIQVVGESDSLWRAFLLFAGGCGFW